MEIELCGYKVQIDEEDYEKVIQWKWRVDTTALHRGLGLYFCRTTYTPDTKYKTYIVYLHRDLMGCVRNDGIVIDHKDGNTLDNRKANLRQCSRTENNRNRKLSKVNTTGYKGVRFIESSGKYQARISTDKGRVHLGSFNTPEEAYASYCEASKKYHGEFGRTK